MPRKKIQCQRREIKDADIAEGKVKCMREAKVHEEVNNMWRWEIKDYGEKKRHKS